MVIFGASGDLTARKILPALARLADRGVLDDGFTVIGVARTEWSDDEFRSHVAEATPEGGPKWRALTERFKYIAGEYDHPDTFDQLRDPPRRGRPGRRHRRQPPLLPRHHPERLRAGGRGPRHPRSASARTPTTTSPGWWWRSPTAATSTAPSPSTSRCTAPSTRVPDLPDRPLHGQGDRPERARPAVRQRHLRAHLEPALRRAGPGDGGRVPRGRTPRRLLRDGRGPARHRAEPRHAGAGPDPHGVTHQHRRRPDPRREGQAAPGHRHPLARRGRGQVGPGPVRRRASIDGEKVLGYRQEQDVAPDSQTETYLALRLRVENWRWAGVPIYVRTGKRLPGPGHRGGPDLPAGAVPPLRPPHQPGPASQHPDPPHPARRGDQPRVRRQGARREVPPPVGGHGLLLLRRPSPARRPPTATSA